MQCCHNDSVFCWHVATCTPSEARGCPYLARCVVCGRLFVLAVLRTMRSLHLAKIGVLTVVDNRCIIPTSSEQEKTS